MLKKHWSIVLLLVCAFLLTGGLMVAASPTDGGGDDISSLATPTIITVTSGLDPDDNQSRTFDNATDGLETLRRAIVMARNATGPVEIRFDIPTDCPSYYSSLDIWHIDIFPTTQTTIFRQLTGDITIDGSTQPGGRNDGPKIMIVGPGGGMKDGITLGEFQTQHNNTIRGLGFQNLRTNIFVNSSNNLIEECWFGLNDDGTEPLLRNNSPAQGSGITGVSLQSSAGNNTIENNVFLGLNGTAATLRGNDNAFRNNYVGTKADGTVDKHANPDLWCTEEDWLGGGGLDIQGKGHLVEDNTIAGLRFDQFDLSQPPDAMRVTVDDIAGAGHTIRNNKIGLDVNDQEVGSCGRGIYLSAHMRGTLIEGNKIYMTQLPGISMNGLKYNQCTLRSNIIVKVDEAIEYGPGLKDDFTEYLPPVVTSIEGTTVEGTSGENCIVELFLDNTDGVVEAYQSLAIVTADAQGSWSATIPFELADNQGIRTTCTTAQFGTIPGMSAGTTTGLSELYTEGEAELGWVQDTVANVDASALAYNSKDELTGVFPGFGVWHNDGTWGNMVGNDAVSLAYDSDDNLAGAFPGFGIWLFDGNGWSQLVPNDANALAYSADGGLTANLPGWGVYHYDGADWDLVTGTEAAALAYNAAGNLVCSFPGAGVYEYVGGNWVMLNNIAATTLAAGTDLAGAFPGFGVWVYDGVPLSWTLLADVDATSMAYDSKDDLAAALGLFGVWYYNQ